MTYDEGQIRFDPAPQDTTPRMTADQAVAVYKQRGLYSDAPSYDPSPTVVFALYTNYGNGKLDSSGKFLGPDHVGQAVWVVTYRNVPVAGSGGGGTGKGGVGATPKPIPMNIVTVVDDASGDALVTMVDRPDAQPYPAQ